MAEWSTPINKITRENIKMLIENYKMNDSLDSPMDFGAMETDSPVRKPTFQPVSKKLFHSPMEEKKPHEPYELRKKTKKRKRLQNSCELKNAYVKECDRDSHSPDAYGGMRKRILISLISNKEYSMEMN